MTITLANSHEGTLTYDAGDIEQCKLMQKEEFEVLEVCMELTCSKYST